jgi:hypothetical protein
MHANESQRSFGFRCVCACSLVVRGGKGDVFVDAVLDQRGACSFNFI